MFIYWIIACVHDSFPGYYHTTADESMFHIHFYSCFQAGLLSCTPEFSCIFLRKAGTWVYAVCLLQDFKKQQQEALKRLQQQQAMNSAQVCGSVLSCSVCVCVCVCVCLCVCVCARMRAQILFHFWYIMPAYDKDICMFEFSIGYWGTV